MESYEESRSVDTSIQDNLAALKQKRKVGEPVEIQSTSAIIPINVTELKNAETEILKRVQSQCFGEEHHLLNQVDQPTDTRKQKVLKKSSNIFELDPMLSDALIRVGGRLRRALINSDAKHPVILPKKHHVVKLIVKYYHDMSGHSGLEYTLSLARQRYWIINARPTVRRILNECFSCRKRQAPVGQQKMPNLPEDRTMPFEVRRGRTTVKRYGVLFTCLTLRAIHLEVASSLDTESFINVLRRFIARRGQPEEMRSDNGGNFVMGEKELREVVQARLFGSSASRNARVHSCGWCTPPGRVQVARCFVEFCHPGLTRRRLPRGFSAACSIPAVLVKTGDTLLSSAARTRPLDTVLDATAGCSYLAWKRSQVEL